MQPDKFTIKSQEAIQAAQSMANGRRNPEITPEHLPLDKLRLPHAAPRATPPAPVAAIAATPAPSLTPAEAAEQLRVAVAGALELAAEPDAPLGVHIHMAGRELADIVEAASVAALLLVENGDAERLLLQVVERLADFERGGLREAQPVTGANPPAR